MTKRTPGIVVTLAAAALAIFLYQRRQMMELLENNRSLTVQIERLVAVNDEIPKPQPPSNESRPLADEPMRELLKLRGEVTVLRRQLDELLKRPATKSTPVPAPRGEEERIWVQQVLNAPPKDKGITAGTFRGKLLRGEMTNIAPAELLLREELLKSRLNETLERSPADFADFQTGFIRATLDLSDETQIQQMHDLIQETCRLAVADGLDIPSKPTSGTDDWVERRFQLDRAATAQFQQLLTPEQRTLFNRAFLGILGVDLGGVGVDKSNYPKHFLGDE